MAKTPGTGCFMLMTTGDEAVTSQSVPDHHHRQQARRYASVCPGKQRFIAGAAIQWLRDGLKDHRRCARLGYFAMKVPHTDGVYVVPAFAGLGAPYWDMYARAPSWGITGHHQGASHPGDAGVFGISDPRCAGRDGERFRTGLENPARVDGGASVTSMLMQFQSDILGANVERIRIIETTALGRRLPGRTGGGLLETGRYYEQMAIGCYLCAFYGGRGATACTVAGRR